MFIGRKKELKILEDLYSSPKFEMLILHGRRRMGKTSLLNEFYKKHLKSCIFFSADKQNEASNVFRFIKEIEKIDGFLSLPSYIRNINNWYDIFEFLNSKIDYSKNKFIVIIDEFTYLLKEDKAFTSKLQLIIDRLLINKNILLILCGSEISTIQKIINSPTEPLYGRKTYDLKLEPFKYFEIKDFFPNYSPLELIETYMVLGGTPLYLNNFDRNKGVKENIVSTLLNPNSILFDDVNNLLNMELRESSIYDSILEAISYKKVSLNEIASKIKEPTNTINKYISVLISLDIIKKVTPMFLKENNRKSMYYLKDNYFAFYYRFIRNNKNILLNFIDGETFYNEYLNKQDLSDYYGKRFEEIAKTYLINLSNNNKIYPPLISLASWWGVDKINKINKEIDLVGYNKESLFLGECKYKNSYFSLEDLNKLLSNNHLFDDVVSFKKIQYYLFSKSKFSNDVKSLSDENKNFHLIKIEDLFKD